MPFIQIQTELDSDDMVTVAPGLAVARNVLLRATGVKGDAPMRGKPIKDLVDAEQIIMRLQLERPVDLELVVRYDDDAEVYRLIRLVVDGTAEGSAEVTGTLLRALPVQTIMRYGTSPAVTIPDYYKPDNFAVMGDARDELSSVRRGPSERALWSVAFTYRSADIRTENAAATVIQGFEIESRTASNWIRRARELGMFDTMAPEPDH